MSGLTVIGNLALDRVDGGDVRPGGCPAFASLALAMLEREGDILTRCAPADRPVFETMLAALPVPVTVLGAVTTSAFGLVYDGEDRSLTVDAIGDTWTPADVAAVSATATWIHVAPLLRSDFPAETLATLATDGRSVSFDGQGLVRVPRTGPLTVDTDFAAEVLQSITVLKLAEDEAAIVAGGRFDESTARALGVPEILVTLGSEGEVLWVDGEATHVPTTPVLGVETTGAGDAFMVGYSTARCEGASPVDAAREASALVARMLAERKRAG